MKRIWTWTIALLLALCILPGTAKAAEVVAEGTCGAEGDNLTWVLTDDGVLTISGEGAMADYAHLSPEFAPWRSILDKIISVVIENGVTSIGAYAFYECNQLTNVTISDSVISIGNSAFQLCHSLTAVDLPDSVTSIGKSAFELCNNLTSVIISSNVTAIGESVFDCCKSLTSVTFLGSVTSIGDSAFSNCNSLTSIDIPESVASIGDGAFWYCQGLISVEIPDGVCSIGKYAFAYCSSLTSVTIGENVSTIGERAFDGCTKINGFYVSQENPNFSNDESGVLFDKAQTELIRAPGAISGSYEIPDSIASVGKSAFYGCSRLVSVVIPESVTDIGEEAFRSCTRLASIYIADGVASIGAQAFYNCTGLISLSIPDSVINIGEQTFFNCTSLASITIPSNITNIGVSIFEHCTKLTEVIIPGSVTNIGEKAFSNCTSLASITIPSSVTNIGKAAFSCCTSLACVTIPESVTDIESNAFYYCTNLTSINLPDSMTSIGAGIFQYCENLTEVIIPDSITSIGRAAFRSCTNLANISIPDSVISIGTEAFMDCYCLTNITIPESVALIDEKAFANCYRLFSVIIPHSVTTIGNSGFLGCTNIKDVYYTGTEAQWGQCNISTGNDYLLNANFHFSVATSGVCGAQGANLVWVLKGGVLTISGEGDMVGQFSNYDSIPWYPVREMIKTVVIDHGVTSIGESAFCDCIYLNDVTIPVSVTTIKSGAFERCNSLTSIFIPDSVTDISTAWVFKECSSLSGIDVDENNPAYCNDEYGVLYSKDKSKLHTAPCSISGEYVIPDSVNEICYYAFGYCKGLTNVVIQDSVVTINNQVFMGCSGLTSLTLSKNLSYLGQWVFNWCSNLSSVYFRGDAPTLDEGAFENFSTSGITVYYPEGNKTWTKIVRNDYAGVESWVPYDPWAYIREELQAIIDNSSMTPEEIKEVVQEMGKEDLEDAMMADEDNSGVVSDLAALEEAVGGPAAVEVTENKTGIDAEDVTIVGANLNQSNGEGDITLVISSPSKENELPKGYRKNAIAIQFSMDLANVEDPENLSVPVKITMPVPKRIKPENLIILHYHSDGAVEEIHPEITLVDEQYYASFVLTSFSDFIFTETPIIRIAGSDRIATSLMLAGQLKEVLGVEKFDAVVVASALNFPDALTGSYLAAEKNAPILLTYPAAHAKIRAYIQENLKPGGTVYILGGEGAVSADFANGLNGFNVKRLAGSDRFGTNLAIMEEAGVSADQPVLIATATNFADSLSASAAGLPMVLVYGSLREDQKEFLATTSRNFIIIGGEAAVSKSLENELAAIGSVTRVAGSSRYETSVLVAEKFIQNPDAVILAYAKNFPDGLCGGPLAYALCAPLILTDNSGYSTADTYVSGISAGIVVGGAGLISDETANQIFDK